MESGLCDFIIIIFIYNLNYVVHVLHAEITGPLLRRTRVVEHAQHAEPGGATLEPESTRSEHCARSCARIEDAAAKAKRTAAYEAQIIHGIHRRSFCSGGSRTGRD